MRRTGRDGAVDTTDLSAMQEQTMGKMGVHDVEIFVLKQDLMYKDAEDTSGIRRRERLKSSQEAG